MRGMHAWRHGRPCQPTIHNIGDRAFMHVCSSRTIEAGSSPLCAANSRSSSADRERHHAVSSARNRSLRCNTAHIERCERRQWAAWHALEQYAASLQRLQRDRLGLPSAVGCAPQFAQRCGAAAEPPLSMLLLLCRSDSAQIEGALRCWWRAYAGGRRRQGSFLRLHERICCLWLIY